MMAGQLIALKEFCGYHNVEYTFVYSLCETELIEVKTIQNEVYVHPDCLEPLEKMVRLHLDLGINSEGVETIFHLLKKIDALQNEIKLLQNKMDFYERE